MEIRSKRIQKATLALIGTIIGAGVFGLPALFSIVGFWPATVLFSLLTGVVLLTHLFYVEIILAFKKRMRLAGYAREVLGKWGYVVAGVTYPLQIIGVNLVYLILGGAFLSSLAALIGIRADAVIWQLVFWFIGATVVLLGLSFLAKVEAVATWLLIASMVLIVGLSASHWDASALIRADWTHFFLPFGIFLFAISGLPVIAEVVEIVGRKRKDSLTAVIVGTLSAAFLSWLFGAGLFLAAHGAIGRNPSDLILMLPHAWSWLIPLMGFLAIITSYMTTAEDLKESFDLDFRISEWWAWAIALLAPLLLLATRQNYLSVLDMVGTVFGGITSLFIVFIAMKLFYGKANRPAYWSVFASVIILLVFAAGILYKFLYQPFV